MLTLACGGGSSSGPADVAGGQAGGNNSNAPPTISGTPATTVAQGGSYAFTPAASDADLDSLTFAAINQPSWINFDPNTGGLSGTPGPNDVGTSAQITITVTDGVDTSSLASFVITVTAAGGASALEVTDTQPVTYEWGTLAAGENSYVDRNFTIQSVPTELMGLDYLRTANDDKFFGGPSAITFDVNVPVTVYVAYDVRNATLPNWLQSWTESALDIVTSDTTLHVYQKAFGAGNVSLGGNEMGNSMYSVLVASANGGGNGGNSNGGDNATPTISGTPANSVTANGVYFFLPTASDADGDNLVFTVANRPKWAKFNVNNGALDGVPDNADAGPYNNIVISVSDGMSSSNLPAFNVSVAADAGGNGAGNTNTAPTISGTPATGVTASNAYNFTPFASDLDGDNLTFTIINRPQWASFSTGNGSLNGVPDSNDVGAYNNIVISVNDGKTAASLPAFRISVAGNTGGNQNTAPTISGSPANSVTGNNAYSFTPSANDADGDSLTFAISNRPKWANFNSGTGSLSGVPDNADAGPYNNIVISVSDGTTTAALSPFNVSVVSSGGGNQNTPPTISGSPGTSVTASNAYSFTPSASDANGDNLSFTIINRPQWAAFSSSNGRLNGVPDNADAGTYNNIMIAVSDGTATASLAPFNIVVTANGGGNQNSAPTISGTPSTSVTENNAYSFSPAANDSDGDNLTFSIANKPGWAAFNTSTGRLSGTPNSGNIGNFNNIVISVSDGTATASLPSFNLQVRDDGATNGSAMLNWNPPTTNSDGSNLNDLGSYRVYYGPSLQSNCRNYPSVEVINSSGVSSALITGLASGTWHFSVTAVDTSGNESACSGNASKTIQ